ncbi:hypothetical protein [Metabacillus indicus]|uniref:Uncharacterized protein n=1 Tax=Metabacillus indicus TaxID=246786 RepID=A0A084H211_METID|nr:hypothetical protein [Metabacillus indicus]KEZ52427.1 hypothetical protein AZ46_0201160 [Metabacillus indicus LMG 22858]KEZ53623.1 hypothetical protein GS18_0201160 [Metabacillus indicus]
MDKRINDLFANYDQHMDYSRVPTITKKHLQEKIEQTGKVLKPQGKKEADDTGIDANTLMLQDEIVTRAAIESTLHVIVRMIIADSEIAESFLKDVNELSSQKPKQKKRFLDYFKKQKNEPAGFHDQTKTMYAVLLELGEKIK